MLYLFLGLIVFIIFSLMVFKGDHNTKVWNRVILGMTFVSCLLIIFGTQSALNGISKRHDDRRDKFLIDLNLCPSKNNCHHDILDKVFTDANSHLFSVVVSTDGVSISPNVNQDFEQGIMNSLSDGLWKHVSYMWTHEAYLYKGGEIKMLILRPINNSLIERVTLKSSGGEQYYYSFWYIDEASIAAVPVAKEHRDNIVSEQPNLN